MAAAEVWRQRKAGVEEGHRRLASNGYWQVMHQGYWKWEHHVIAEQWLGRPLTDGETVVHLGAADDNSIESLGLRIVIPLVECVTAGPVNANAPETL